MWIETINFAHFMSIFKHFMIFSALYNCCTRLFLAILSAF